MFSVIKRLCVLFFLLIGSGVLSLGVFFAHPFFFFQSKKWNTLSFLDKDVRLYLLLATSPYQWSKGLMFQKNLPQDSGMLFVFPDETKRSFWMKYTTIPLDIIFIASDKTVISIYKNALPCMTFFCPLYRSKGAAQYVLEVNAGFVDRYGIAEGDSIILG